MSTQFTTPLRAELIGRNLWRVLEPFEYHVGSFPSDDIITVESGFVTNFASVPRVFWPILSPIDSHGKAGVVHDYAYFRDLYQNRKRCDEIFLEGLRVLETPEWKAIAMYDAVRAFGWHRWNFLREIKSEELTEFTWLETRGRAARRYTIHRK